jgi:hypothetical protein
MLDIRHTHRTMIAADIFFCICQARPEGRSASYARS